MRNLLIVTVFQEYGIQITVSTINSKGFQGQSKILHYFFSDSSLHRSEFLTLILFLLSDELLKLFLARQVYFCFSEKICISVLLLKDNCAGYKILGHRFVVFFLSKLWNMSPHCLLLCMVSGKKSDMMLTFVSLRLSSWSVQC